MQRKNLAIVLVSTFFAFSTLYLPQPLLPLLSRTFLVSSADAALFISVTMLPLAIAPVLFGYILQSLSSKKLLCNATLLLALTNLLVLFVDAYWQLLTLRAAQGLLLPAIFTALMTYCSSIAPAGKVRQYIAYYIATSILGGFFGRIFSGVIATWFDWRYGFVTIGALLVIGWRLQRQLDNDTQSNGASPNSNSGANSGAALLIDALKQPLIRNALLTIFTLFFTFSALLNALPFRLVALQPTISEFAISSVYLGYLIGIAVATHSEKIIERIGGQVRGTQKTFAIYFLSLMLFFIPLTQGMTGFMLIACACFFLLHAVLSGYVNQLARGNSSSINGLYVAAYYAGGSLGAWLPAFIYRDWGWNRFLMALLLVVLMSYMFARRLR